MVSLDTSVKYQRPRAVPPCRIATATEETMSPLACFVPPDLLHEIARTTKSAKLRRSALDSLAVDAAIRSQRAENAARTLAAPVSANAGSGGSPQRRSEERRVGKEG